MALDIIEQAISSRVESLLKTLHVRDILQAEIDLLDCWDSCLCMEVLRFFEKFSEKILALPKKLTV